MRRCLRKAVLALMVGIGMVGAVSAGAQTETEKVWQRVGDYYVDMVPDTYGDTTICNELVRREKHRTSPWSPDIYWTGEIFTYVSGTGTHNKACIVEKSVYSYLSFAPRCKKGIYRNVNRPGKIGENLT